MYNKLKTVNILFNLKIVLVNNNTKKNNYVLYNFKIIVSSRKLIIKADLNFYLLNLFKLVIKKNYSRNYKTEFITF